MSRLARDGTVEPVSRDQILRYERRQGKNGLPCLADHEQDCPYPVDLYFFALGLLVCTFIPLIIGTENLTAV